jgi:hypothetical protein
MLWRSPSKCFDSSYAVDPYSLTRRLQRPARLRDEQQVVPHGWIRVV